MGLRVKPKKEMSEHERHWTWYEYVERATAHICNLEDIKTQRGPVTAQINTIFKVWQNDRTKMIASGWTKNDLRAVETSLARITGCTWTDVHESWEERYGRWSNWSGTKYYESDIDIDTYKTSVDEWWNSRTYLYWRNESAFTGPTIRRREDLPIIGCDPTIAPWATGWGMSTTAVPAFKLRGLGQPNGGLDPLAIGLLGIAAGSSIMLALRSQR